MTRGGRSLWVFGLYVWLVAAGLLLIPNIMLSLFGLPETNEIWIRVVGIPLALLGGYYYMAGRKDLVPFIQWSIPARASVILFYLILALTGTIKPTILLFGVVDLLGAGWTTLSVRADQADVPPGSRGGGAKPEHHLTTRCPAGIPLGERTGDAGSKVSEGEYCSV